MSKGNWCDCSIGETIETSDGTNGMKFGVLVALAVTVGTGSEWFIRPTADTFDPTSDRPTGTTATDDVLGALISVSCDHFGSETGEAPEVPFSDSSTSMLQTVLVAGLDAP